MSWTLIKAQIGVLANEVTGVVNFYTRKTAYNDQNEFDTLYLDEANDRVLGFETFRQGLEEEQDNYNSYKDTYTVVIRGFIGIDEDTDGSDSYTVLENLMDSILNKFRRNRTMNDTAVNSDPPQLSEIITALRLGAWCWEQDLTLVIHDRTTFTSSIS